DAYFLHPALAGQAVGIPLIWNAIGAWTGSPRCKGREDVLGSVLTDSKIVAVRDEPTRALFTRLAPRAKVEFVPDTAFGLSAIWPKSEDSTDLKQWRAGLGLDGPYIVVQADRRIAAHQKTLARIQQRLGARVVVLPVCYCHGDRAEGFPALPGDTDRNGSWPSPHLIRTIIAGASFVVATSLHAAITAVSYGVRVARVSYPYERKFEQLSAFEGIAMLDDEADLERLLARGNAVEARVHAFQTQLTTYWDKVADVVTTSQSQAARPLQLPRITPPAASRPVRVEIRAAAGRLVRAGLRPIGAITTSARPAAYGGKPILDFEAIRRSRLNSEPYRWGQQTELFAPAETARLVDEFPTRGFWTIAGVEPGRHYQFVARSLISMGSNRPNGLRNLSDAWSAFALDLLSPEYRAAVSDAVGLDLSHALLEANITQYGQGHELSSHIDLKEKLVTQIFYFNTEWPVEDGGCLAIMSDRSGGTDAALIPPVAGSSAILVRSHKSWHRVTPVREGLIRQRRSLNVIFHLPESKSSMWPQWPIATRRGASRLAQRMTAAVGVRSIKSQLVSD
ncbi:MAG: polysaccharide pyruvyl transferase family protein, partial [Novosphingobium sp.]